MKKTILILTLWLSVMSVHAQDYEEPADDRLLSKRGHPILPEEGDWALGFDAVPFLRYVGNIFNGTQNNTVFAGFPNNSQQVFLKLFSMDDKAFRARLRIDNSVFTDRARVALDNQPIPDPDVQVTDEWTQTSTDVFLGAGLEYRKGSGRVVGVYGAELGLMYSNSFTKYEYGNPITEENTAPTTTAAFQQINNGRFERRSETKSDKDLGVGVNGFLGVEYFVAPKISVGAEFTLGVSFMKDFRQAETFEFWDDVSNSVQTRTSVAEGDEEFVVDTGNYGGSINLLFYF